MRELRDAARRRTRSWRSASATTFTPQGPDPRRDVPAARRLRRPDARPAGHGRRARRLLRPGRHARFAAGAPAWHLQLAGDAVARAGARHHAPDVGAARAALADRGHLGLRGAARAARRGGARWSIAFAAGATSAASCIPLATLNAGFTDRSTIGLAYHQARSSSSISSIGYGDAGLQRLLKAFGRGIDEGGGAREGARRLDSTQLQTSFDESLDESVRRGAHCADAGRRRCPTAKGPTAIATLRPLAAAHPDSFAVQLAAGRRWRPRRPRGGPARSSGPVTLVPMAIGDDSPRAALAALAESRRIAAAPWRSSSRCSSSSTHGDGIGAPPACDRPRGERQRAASASRWIASWRSIRSTAPRTPSSGRLALGRDDGPAAIRVLELALSLNPSDVAAAHSRPR